MMYQTITMRQLEYMLDSHREMFLLDVRNRASYEMCHIDGAVNIPYSELDGDLDSLPVDKIIVCYCARGGQSMLACNHLSGMGYQVVNVANGLSSYQGKYLVKGQNLH